jgi:hypothetical protein
MVVFAREFGSDDPFVDAVQTARWMSEHDALAFCPHIGIANGPVTVGYVGTPIRYNCSVFGAAVAMAARCAAVRPEKSEDQLISTAMVFPSSEWGGRSFEEVFPPVRYRNPDGTIHEQPNAWKMRQPRKVPMKNLPDAEITEVIKCGMYFPQQSAEDRAREALDEIIKAGRYWPSHTKNQSHSATKTKPKATASGNPTGSKRKAKRKKRQ